MTYFKTTINQPFLECLECCGKNSEVGMPVEKLWYFGAIPSSRPPVVAIVGARHSTEYGEDIAYRAAYELAKREVIIVSGMAYGIDSCAHRGCLDAGGTTIAVLGTSIDKIYPQSNRELAERIIKKGAIISEYAPGFPTKAYCFQARNRIVSGLADVVLIVEASKKSGTQGTFEFALKQGKDVFAVPGDITRPMSAGTNEMLKVANPYTDVSDILISLGLYSGLNNELQLDGLSDIERKVYLAIRESGGNYEAAAKIVAIPAEDFSRAVTMLEMNGYLDVSADWTKV